MTFINNNLKKFLYNLSFSVLIILLFTNNSYASEDGFEIPVRSESITIVKNDTIVKYKITPGDIISVSVYDEPNFLQPEILVRPDGYATIDPIGEIFVDGLDIQQLTKTLQSKFSSYINDPIVSINIKEFSPASICIFGAVQKPGIYQQLTNVSKFTADSKNPLVKTDLTLSNVIANAGGISNDADISNITVTSTDNKLRKVDLWKLAKDGDVQQNLKLKTGDVIFVPKIDSITINDEDFKLLAKMSFFPSTFPVRVLGEVARGGIFNISGESPYLNTAIVNASGYTLEANKSIVVVYRKAHDDKLVKIYVDPFNHDFVLRPNDLVDVRKRTLMKVVSGSDYISRIISPFLNLGSTYNSWAEVFNPSRRNYYRN